ncbi:MAG: hypothetical protein NTV07_00815, partial [Candidatus Omnitrophica bacterium]|nr:hypothetical protein [Candidatus Omnitrophota bacterium]
LPSLQRRLFMDFVFGAKLAELSDKYGMSQVTVRGEIADLRRQAKAHIIEKELSFMAKVERARRELAPKPARPAITVKGFGDLAVNGRRIEAVSGASI